MAILFGTKTGLVELPMCLLNEGDLMLLPDPGYPDYLSGVVLAGAQFKTFPLLAENRFLPDYNAIPLEDKEAAKLMYLNYPNNPTGATADLKFLRKRLRLQRSIEFPLSMILRTVRSALTAKNRPAFLKRKEPRTSALKCTHCRKPTIWPAGALDLL